MQDVLFDRGDALPLAVLVLPELLARSDAGLDERDLPDVGEGRRRAAGDPGQLVPGELAAEADDGPAGLRRRRQSGPNEYARQGKRTARQGARAQGLGLSAAPPGPTV